jgi:hypothetical protein
MERELQPKRAELAQQQRLNRRPPVKRVKEKDVTAALAQLRQLLHSDVGLAAPVLKELVGDVVIEARIVEGEAKPQMFARFTINALPALAAIGQASQPDGDAASPPLWDYRRQQGRDRRATETGSRDGRPRANAITPTARRKSPGA